MPDAREYHADFEAAEAAATQGDFARAETLLRAGLARQEAALGGAHPDVASTLNNLAVVCETLGRIDDAEKFYRRAHAVATATRPDGDPLVTTSLANLQDFCRAHGRRLEDTAPPTAAFEPAPGAAGAAAAPGVAAAETHQTAPPPLTRQSSRPVPVPAKVAPAPAATRAGQATPATVPRGFAAALFVVALLATAAVSWLWLRPTVPATPAAAPAEASPPVPPAQPTAPEAAPPAAATVAPPAREVPPAHGAPAAPSAPAEPPVSAPATATAPSGGEARVLAADLCASLETRGRAWRCAPLDAPAAAGRVSFVTRVAAPRAMRLRHRWSLGGQVRQTVELSVAASPTEGYRTYSRQSVTPGTWTVAVLDASGAVLREVRFDVR